MKKKLCRQSASYRFFRRAPIAQAVALALAAGGLFSEAHAQQAFSPAWFAAKGANQATATATGLLPNGNPVSSLTSPQGQSNAARERLQTSIANLNTAAQAIALQQALQAQARQAALLRPSSVPDGLGEGGLKIDENELTKGWSNANAPTQTMEGGQTTVTIEQTADKAILNWETFNVGRNTTVNFEQDANWAVLNRVNDPNARPSQIQGQIKADGTVFILNRNGVVFEGSSQVNVRNLVAAAANITDAQFQDNGLYGASATTPTFTGAGGAVKVEQGALIQTHTPQSVTQGGGYVLLLGKEVENAGEIVTRRGQTALAAGDSFIIRRGVGTDGNQASTTRGNEVTASGSGTVTNAGLIQAATGDVTLTGAEVRQQGVILASTSVDTRGTVHLTATDADGKITLGEGSATAILLEDTDATALDSQRDSLLAPAVDNLPDQNIVAADAYRRDQSLVEIKSGGTVDFEGGSLTLATGGQIAVDAGTRALVRDGAILDVSGAVGVQVAMEANSVKINIQGNEQRDAPVNRDGTHLNNSDVWIDVRDLVFVPAGTNGYESDRWYTAGGLLEVGGYLGLQGHGVGQWMAQGGTVRFTGNDVVTQLGSKINLSGGTLDVQTGSIRQSWLKGADGQLYEVSSAPGDLLYTGLYRGFENNHERWGQTEYWYNPIIAPTSRLENGYTVGRDAGTLVIGTKNAVLEGEIVGDTFQGNRQTQAAQQGLDGYHQSQKAVARGASLVVGSYTPYYVKDSGTLQHGLTATANTLQDVILGTAAEKIAAGLELDSVLPEDREGVLYLDTAQLNGFELGVVKIAARNGIAVDGELNVAPAGEITLYGPQVNVNADLTAHGGTIRLGNVLNQVASSYRIEDTTLAVPAGTTVAVTVAEGVTLDTSGLWSNLVLEPENIANLPYQNGGSVSIRSSGDVTLGAGSLIDVSSGAALLGDGSFTGGRGGNIRLQAGAQQAQGGTLTLDGTLAGHGVNGGGTLTLQHGGTVVVGGEVLQAEGWLEAGEAAPVSLALDEPLTVAAGDLLPVAATYTQVVAGQVLDSAITYSNTGHTLEIVVGPGGWDLTGTNMDIYINGSNSSTSRYRGNTGTRKVVPEGAVVTRINAGTLPAGYEIPASVAALPSPAYTVAAGQPALVETVIPAGSLLKAGTVLAQRVAVRPPLTLESERFRSGFSHYDVTGQHGLLVAEGSRIDVAMPVYRLADGALQAATGSDPATALELWTPPLYLEDPARGVLTQRQGASLSLQAGTSASPADDMASVEARVGRGAVITVDPGQSIAVRSIGQLTMNGALQAWGGRIELGSVNVGGVEAARLRAAGHGRSIWIGGEAVLDAAGRASVATDALGRRYGIVDAGGEIVVGSGFDHEAGEIAALSDLFVVVREGALLDVSGAGAVLDVPGQGAVTVAGAGGAITLASSNGLYVDGALRAEAGGAGAAGGSLTLVLDTPFYRSDSVRDRVQRARDLVLVQERSGGALPSGIDANEAADLLAYGHGVFGVNQISDSGFDRLTLASDGGISFESDLSLQLGQSLNLYAQVLGLTEAAPQESRVELAAPYVRLAGYGSSGGGDGLIHPTILGGLSSQAPAGRLTIQAGRLLDLGGLTIGGLYSGGGTVMDRRAFEHVEFASVGDLRLLGGDFHTPGNLTLAAAQIYPVTGAIAGVYAGWHGNNADFDPERVLTLARTTDEIPAVPYSAFGSLTLGAATIDQGGILRAPLGELALGTSRAGIRNTQAVNLLDGSLTSVSAAGLVMPYGGTSDGVTWYYDGEEIELQGVGSPRAGSVTLLGKYVDVREGAVIDISGGGELTGAGFVSGRGGSTDARYHPLVQVGSGGFTLPGLSSNPVYAIVPGVQAPAAPAGGESGVADLLVGQQITIGAGVPGVPAGTYTLLPSTYALLPGAFRVEFNGLSGQGAAMATQALRNGSWATSGMLSIAGTDIHDNLFRQVILTPANVLRTYSQYDETSYAEFARADAATLGVPRAQIEADAKQLRLRFTNRDPDSEALSLSFAGTVLGEAAEGGHGSTAAVIGASTNARIEILGDDAAPSSDFGIAVRASDLNGIEVNRLTIGSVPVVVYGQSGNLVRFVGGPGVVDPAASIAIRSGVRLSAPEVMLVSRSSLGSNNAILIEQGAIISTLGQGATAYDSTDGFIYQPESVGVVAVSNGTLQWLAPEADLIGRGPSRILVGACASGDCTGTTQLYSEGSIAFVTDNDFQLDDAVRYGTRHLSLAVGAFNIGSGEALADAAARGALTPGLVLNQQVMERLLQGDTSVGAPALETLELIAGRSVNFFDIVTLSTLDADGNSLLDNLLLTTPAIYGYGAANDVALIRTGHLIWNGSDQAPGAVAAGGAGTGSGTFQVEAERISFGYGPWGQPDGVSSLGRLALGFAHVNLLASERITANNAGTLAVYQSQGEHVAGEGRQYSGGNLNVVTPLWTGEAGSVNKITAGGAITVSAASGAADPATVSDLGAELSLTAGAGLSLDTTVALPSGKLTLAAENDVVLGGSARLDLSGRSVEFFDDEEANQYSWGGDVTLESTAGNVRQAAGAVIDLSAEYNQAGRLTAIALAESAGTLDLQGAILGGASGYYEAGGTWVPYLDGGIEVRAQSLGAGSLSDAFAALNQRLNDGKVFGLRSFQIKRGDLTIGNELKANQIEVSLDGGHLTVAGTVDASGGRVGSIRLAGRNGLTIGGNGMLDAHGTLLRLDSYGKIIDAPNRAIVELNSGNGVLTLAEGARMDLRHGTADARVQADPSLHDGRALGTVELFAPRLGGATGGDVAIDARGALDVQGAKSIALNAVQRYDDADYGSDPAAGGRPYQVIDQAYLDGKHAESTAFIDAALGNANLLNAKLAGLNNATYRDVFHLRPGVEIVSRTPDGDIVVSGDLDLSGHRYASLNPHTQQITTVYGSGEPGALVIRAGGDLNIYGSINDGFAPPPDTPDDNGWVLTPGVQAYGGDVIVPGAGVVLAEGTRFLPGKTLNYDLPIQAATLAAGTELPAQAVLAAALEVPAGTVLSADVTLPDGTVHRAGTVLGEALPLPAGSRLDAGFRLPAATSLAAMVWPAGVPLPNRATSNPNTDPDGVFLAGALQLPVGALIPSMTDVKLVDDIPSVALRPTGDGGLMGRNWAVAAMLPEGSLSWSMRLVAGADVEAADSRRARPRADGSLVLADTHYGLYERTEIVGGEGAWYIAGTDELVPEDTWGLDPATACSWGYYTCEYRVVGGEEFVVPYPVAQHFSVLRTGTGDLDLIAGGNMALHSLYGVYTAGTSTASRAGDAAQAFDRARGTATGPADGTYLGTSGSADAAVGAAYEALVDGGGTYAAWYPDDGGNLLLNVGGNLIGDIQASYRPAYSGEELRPQRSSADVGNWLWRQGSGDTVGVDPIHTSWWINFGTYVQGAGVSNDSYGLSSAEKNAVAAIPELVGFTGLGTLGGGNLTVQVAGDAGLLDRRGTSRSAAEGRQRSQGLVVVVGSTGRVLSDGELLLTGGGDLRIDVDGALNPGLAARATATSGTSSDAADYRVQNVDLNGVLGNLRGGLQLQTGEMGGVALTYFTTVAGQVDSREARAFDPFTASLGTATGGPVLMLGDSAAYLTTRGDLVVAGTGDPGRVALPHALPYVANGVAQESGGYAWFSLWTDNTAINLFSAGGDVTPSVQLSEVPVNGSGIALGGKNHTATDGRFVWPGQLSVTAADGSVFFGKSALGMATSNQYNTAYSLLLAPSGNARLEILAGDSIYASGYVVSRSAAAQDVVPTVFRPAFGVFTSGGGLTSMHNLAPDAIRPTTNMFSLFAFGPNTASNAAAAADDPVRIYAREGDIVGLGTGEILTFYGPRTGQTWYEGAGPVWMRAGRDIVRSGSLIGTEIIAPDELGRTPSSTQSVVRGTGNNLFVHGQANDVSIVEAGRDILFSNFDVAGPGTLEISAGRNIVMVGQTEGGAYGETRVRSLGPVVPGDDRPGASIVVQAGLGDRGADWRGFLDLYLDPANRAETGVPLEAQAGKVAHTYEEDLAGWLAARYGFEGTAEEALAYFAGLPAEQQRIFARRVYFAELRAGGREYNDADGPRFGSYLRGRNAIAALFPDEGGYSGDLLAYGGAGIHTYAGGDIQVLTPGGAQTYGVEGDVPPSTAGVITQGQGDIQMYSQGSILLGLSRIMTTFGGDIFAWSAEGDINAGRGAKTTVVYTPPLRVYDQWGNVTLSPQTPSTGAGIATLNPIPEVPPGDVDLIAPLGTIDAGEAGIRVSGNVNLAALQVVNAENIQVQGEATGLPVVASVNIGALTSASAAANSATQAAQDMARNQTRQARPSIISVQVLGFGEATSSIEAPRDAREPRAQYASYDPDSAFQFLGTDERHRLTEAERRNLERQ
ncbi:filamentous haemagglutinin family protein [Pseudothauera rhizosphaerae]|uniref:Filamentous hemagglutinin N-terminal domain-containing protein n=1 Tax=Pseudothauera rhizosphaerae TaxID=2565932 RepID=A0A4S4ALP4_9RHOO|nr:filamentous haemagglutinin family protein [Pseudothauera rhizosphaerae]THF60457.1 filamentous hemagglutinin N-terminal domain-containing protein [Pseudothauera rhizosphaerae]